MGVGSHGGGQALLDTNQFVGRLALVFFCFL